MLDFFFDFGELFRVRLFPRPRRRFGRRFEERLTRRIAASQPMTIPEREPFPKPRTTTQPFPRGPAANDPIFRQGRRIFGRALSRVLGLFGVGLTIFDIISMGKIELEKQRLSEIESVIKILKQREADKLPTREVVIRDPAGVPTTPTPKIPRPRAPDLPGERRPLPDISPTSPPVRLPFPGQLPGTLPTTPTIPAPQPLPRPSPQIDPVFDPIFVPATRPGLLSQFPIRFPTASPRLQPLADPLPFAPPGLPGLTPPNTLVAPFSVGTIQLPQQTPSPQTQTRRCQNVKRRRRRKGKCREGFFKERPGSTEFITWRTTDCGPRLVRS